MTRVIVRGNRRQTSQILPVHPSAFSTWVVCFLGGLISAVSANDLADGAPADSELVEQTIAPLLVHHCADCHGGADPQAGISLARPAQLLPVQSHYPIWVKILRQVHGRQMPPADDSSLENSERQRLKNAIILLLSQAGGSGFRDPGRVTIRRLNRAEYRNTIRDLFGIDFALPDDFPIDDVGYDFDNIGDVLTLSPLLMEKYLNTADQIVRSVIVTPESIQTPSALITANKFNGGVVAGSKGRVLHAEGRFDIEHEFPGDGTYLLRARAWAEQAGGEPARMTFRIGERVLKSVEVLAEPSDAQHYWALAKIAKGKHLYSVSYDNDYYRSDDPDPLNRDRNLWVEYLDIVGPIDETLRKLPEPHLRIMGPIMSAAELETTDEAARVILRRFASRAFRRAATDRELTRLLALVRLAQRSGGSFERGVRLAIQAVLISPKFLFRGEIDALPNDPASVRRVSEYELASRLSYFLWSSTPDGVLLDRARQGTLRTNLRDQVQRMLKDPRARALVDNFGGQWLQLRDIDTIMIDAVRFPAFDDDLRRMMRTETEMFFSAIIKEDRSVIDFIDGKQTFLNERLAAHYGIEGIEGDTFRRVELDGQRRSGVLTQASILALTSNPTRTSPVKRGKWILKQILGAPPPPPPPGVDELAEEKPGAPPKGLRERLELHRTNKSCAVCHVRMDPLGLALENYDAIGRWRDKDGPVPIDARGTLPDGRQFDGPVKLKEILRVDADQFRWCLTEKMLTYALGRGIEYYDYRAVAEITSELARENDRFSALILAVVRSYPFQFRRGDGGSE